MRRASIGPLSGPIVIVGMLVFYGMLLTLAIYSSKISHSEKTLPAGHPKRLSAVRQEES
jgi:uncharacterized membrane protein